MASDVNDILTIFREVAPEFNGSSDDTVSSTIELYIDMASEKQFGPYYNRAVALYAAHMMKLADIADTDGTDGGILTASGPIESEREGDLQRSYGQRTTSSTSSDNTDNTILLRKTVYGRMFLALRSMCVVTVCTRMG